MVTGRFKYIYNLIYIILASIPIALSGQQNPGAHFAYFSQPVYTIGTRDGLPTDAVTSLVLDNRGFAWIRTANGLVRWDGIKAVLYQHDPFDTTSITGNFIKPNSLKYDAISDRLLVGTGGGLSVLNLQENSFTNYYPDKKNNQTIPGGINSIFIDWMNETWLGTDKGFSKYNPKCNCFRQLYLSFNLTGDGEVNISALSMVYDIAQDRHNPEIFWMATLGGLIKFNARDTIFNLFRAPGKQYEREMNQLTKLVLHSNGNTLHRHLEP